MLRPVPLLLCLTFMLSGCATLSQSRFNPLNWIERPARIIEPGSATQQLVPADRQISRVDFRAPVTQITSLRVDSFPAGIIVTARGVAAGTGYFNAALVPVGAENGVLSLEMRAEAPVSPAPGGTPAISAAAQIDTADLAGIRRTEVRSASNALSATR